MREADLADDKSAGTGHCLTEVSTAVLVAGAVAVSAVLWALILVVL